MKYIFNKLNDKGLIFGRNNIINALKKKQVNQEDRQCSTQSPKVKTAHKLQDTEIGEQINENSQ